MQRPVPQVGDQGRLLRLLQGQRIEGFEKSFKMAPGALLGGRILVGVPRASASAASLIAICEKLAMPRRFLEAFGQGIEAADTIHFGFEENAPDLLYKAYLEYASRFHQASGRPATASAPIPATSGAPILLHLAYKWDAHDPARGAVARYHCHPHLPLAALKQRLEGVCAGSPDGRVLRAANGIVEMAASRATEPLMYLDVTEEGNPRASFDVNVHAADIRLREIEPQLRDMQRHFAIPADGFERLWAAVGDEKLGHVSGGRSRDGGEFLTVYHEASAR